MNEDQGKLEAYILVSNDAAQRIAYRLAAWVAEPTPGTSMKWYKLQQSPMQGQVYVVVDASDGEMLIGTASGESLTEFGQWYA